MTNSDRIILSLQECEEILSEAEAMVSSSSWKYLLSSERGFLVRFKNGLRLKREHYLIDNSNIIKILQLEHDMYADICVRSEHRNYNKEFCIEWNHKLRPPSKEATKDDIASGIIYSRQCRERDRIISEFQNTTCTHHNTVRVGISNCKKGIRNAKYYLKKPLCPSERRFLKSFIIEMHNKIQHAMGLNFKNTIVSKDIIMQYKSIQHQIRLRERASESEITERIS